MANVNVDDVGSGREVIWYRDPGGLFAGDRIAHFVPERYSSFASQLNALLRLSIYSAVVLLLFRRLSAAIYVPLGTAAFTFLVYSCTGGTLEGLGDRDRDRDRDRDGDRRRTRTREGQACVVPTHDNPFMNVTMNEYTADPDRPSACAIAGARTAAAAESMFDDNLFRDIDDVFRRRTSSRPFYTMPNTAIPNDQTGFARWCYATGPSCKEGDGAQCFRNIDASDPPYVGGDT